MKILVPIDYQPTSLAAFRYATYLADTINASITVLHVHPGGMSLETALSYESMDERIDRIKKRLTYFTTIHPKKEGISIKDVPVEYLVRFGIPGFTISDCANDLNFDLIVMGTRDKHFIYEKIIGSASSIAINLSKCPVLLVHQNTIFNSMDKIAFAFDKQEDIEVSIEQFLKLNKHFKAKTDFIHISNDENENISAVKADIVNTLFDQNNPDFSFEIKNIKGGKTIEEIKDYCLRHKVDLLCLVHQKKGILESFLNQSTSVQLAHDFHLPVIIFK